MAKPPRTEPYGKTPKGDALLAARVDAGFGQDEFAKQCGIERGHYRKMEAGENHIKSVDVIGKLAIGFGVSTQTLRAYLDGKMELATFRAQRGAGHQLNELQLRRVEERRKRLGVTMDVVHSLVSDTVTGAAMSQLPVELRRAVIGFTHVYGVPVDKVLVIAKQLVATHGEADSAPTWYERLRQRIQVTEESGTRLTPPKINLDDPDSQES